MWRHSLRQWKIISICDVIPSVLLQKKRRNPSYHYRKIPTTYWLHFITWLLYALNIMLLCYLSSILLICLSNMIIAVRWHLVIVHGCYLITYLFKFWCCASKCMCLINIITSLEYLSAITISIFSCWHFHNNNYMNNWSALYIFITIIFNLRFHFSSMLYVLFSQIKSFFFYFLQYQNVPIFDILYFVNKNCWAVYCV